MTGEFSIIVVQNAINLVVLLGLAYQAGKLVQRVTAVEKMVDRLLNGE